MKTLELFGIMCISYTFLIKRSLKIFFVFLFLSTAMAKFVGKILTNSHRRYVKNNRRSFDRHQFLKQYFE